MAKIPTNQKLWNMFVAQAKTRFNKWPSIAASNWVHGQYVQTGGKFAESVYELDPKERREYAKSEAEKKKKKAQGFK